MIKKERNVANVVNVRKIWMSQKEAMKYLGVSKDWLKDRRDAGILHYSMVGNTTFYLKSEIDNLVVGGVVIGKSLFTKARYEK